MSSARTPLRRCCSPFCHSCTQPKWLSIPLQGVGSSLLPCYFLCLLVHASHQCPQRTHSVSYTQPNSCDQQSSRRPCNCHLHQRIDIPPGSSLAACLRDYLTKHMEQAGQVFRAVLCCTAADGSAPESDAGSSSSSSRDHAREGLRTCCTQGPSEATGSRWAHDASADDGFCSTAAIFLSTSSCGPNRGASAARAQSGACWLQQSGLVTDTTRGQMASAAMPCDASPSAGTAA